MIPGMSLATFSRILLAGLSLAAGAAHAQGGERGAADAALVERIREAVIQQLRESGALERAIDEGVERYVERQRAEAAQRGQREAETRTEQFRAVLNRIHDAVFTVDLQGRFQDHPFQGATRSISLAFVG